MVLVGSAARNGERTHRRATTCRHRQYGDAKDRRLRGGQARGESLAQIGDALGLVLGERDETAEGLGITLRHLGPRGIEVNGGARAVTAAQQVVDHPLEAHRAAVIGGVDARDAVAVEFLHFRRKDGAAAAAEDQDVGAALGRRSCMYLKNSSVRPDRGDGDRRGILLDGALDDLGGAAVVAEVNDLGTGSLNDAAHHVDRCIMPVEKGRGGDDSDGPTGLGFSRGRHGEGLGHSVSGHAPNLGRSPAFRPANGGAPQYLSRMPTTEAAVPFPPVSYTDWRAGVEAEPGPDVVSRRLRAITEDGIAIEPLYAPGGPGDAEARNLAGLVVGLLPAGAGLIMDRPFRASQP